MSHVGHIDAAERYGKQRFGFGQRRSHCLIDQLESSSDGWSVSSAVFEARRVSSTPIARRQRWHAAGAFTDTAAAGLVAISMTAQMVRMLLRDTGGTEEDTGRN